MMSDALNKFGDLATGLTKFSKNISEPGMRKVSSEAQKILSILDVKEFLLFDILAVFSQLHF